MGKVRRNRQKYHLAGTGTKPSNDGNTVQTIEESKKDEDESLGWNIKMENDIFSGMDIKVDGLKNSLDDDVKSLRSVSKSYKSIKKSLGGKSMTKVDKRKLRHCLFLKKIEFSHSMLKQNKKNKNGDPKNNFTISELDGVLPRVDMMFHKPETAKVKQPQPVSTKQRGIKKAKHRQQEMTRNVEAYKNLISDPQFKNNPFEIISKRVQDLLQPSKEPLASIQQIENSL